MTDKKKEEKEEEKPAEESKEEVEEKEKPSEEVKVKEPEEEVKASEPEKKEEVKKEKQAKKPEKKPEPTGKYKDLIKQIESLSLADLSELVKELEERFGVSAATAVPTAPVAGAPTPGAPAPAPEKARFTVVLSACGANKIAAIKAVRELKQDLGLKDAKDFVEAAPKTVLEDVAKEEAGEAKKKLEEAGCQVELK